MKPSSYIKYLASLLIFGTNGVVVSFIPLGSAEVVWWRTALGSVFLALVLLCTRQRLHLQAMRAQWARILVSGAVMGLSWVFLFEAYRLSGVGSSALVYYFGPGLGMALSPVKKLINILLNTKNKREERDVRLMERGEDPFFFTIKNEAQPGLKSCGPA